MELNEGSLDWIGTQIENGMLAIPRLVEMCEGRLMQIVLS